MLLFFVHEPKANKKRRGESPNRNCARNAFCFSSGAAAVPPTVTRLSLAGHVRTKTHMSDFGVYQDLRGSGSVRNTCTADQLR
jgi:hypothetical protein